MSTWSFLRADDLGADGRFMANLAPVLDGLDLPCMLGVIPHALSDEAPLLIEALARRTRGPLWVAQHGSDHRNRATAGKKDELGDATEDAAHLARLTTGRRLLMQRCGSRFIDVYIPPWNTRTPHTDSLVAAAGLLGISGWRGRGGDTALDACTDVQKSYRPPQLLAERDLSAALAAHLGGGVLLHPALWDPKEVARVATAIAAARAHGTLRPPTAQELRNLTASFAAPVRFNS